MFSNNNVTYRWNFTDQRSLFFDNPTLTGIVTVPTPPVVASNRATNTRWVIDYVGSLGLGQATSDNFGTVKLNSDSAVPVVYRKQEVDTLLSEIRPVALGGTGANAQAQARTNLDAAKAGSNNDISALTALADVPTVIQAAIAALIPPGTYFFYGGDTVPPGYIAGLGQVLSRANFPGIFAAFGTKYGTGNNDGLTFTMPQLVDVFLLGAHPSFVPPGGSARAVGATGGSHSLILSLNQMPQHNHDAAMAEAGNHIHSGNTGSAGNHTHLGTADAGGAHSHSLNFRRAASYGAGSLSGDLLTPTYTNATTQAINENGTHSHTLNIVGGGSHSHNIALDAGGVHTHPVTVNNSGNSSPINNMPKFLGGMLIVKT
ncbi:MAG: tail fiber protein [Leptolyngbyaceae cyanobacterium SL_5_14]|nr:tail fiber protein [Leptolyngbyaceae cyanobacterium SL_5_14]